LRASESSSKDISAQQSQMMYELIATTVRGLEEIAINEVEELVGVKAERDTLTTVGRRSR